MEQGAMGMMWIVYLLIPIMTIAFIIVAIFAYFEKTRGRK